MNQSKFLFLFFILFSLAGGVHADSTITATAAAPASDIQAQIDARNNSIAALENEIAQYQTQLNAASTQDNTLSAALNQLTISQKKLEASIAVTQDKIAATNLEITQLTADIGRKQTSITDDQKIIGVSLATVRENDDFSFIELLLGRQTLSQALAVVDNLANLQKSIQGKIADLSAAKTVLQNNVTQTKSKKADLVSLNTSLTGQRKLIIVEKNEQTTLLAQTKNTESNYKKIIADKTAQEAAFSQEILQYEEALHLNVNPSSLPSTGSAALHWPLDKIIVTQYFGNTDFATKNPQIYNGKGHTGVDFGAAIGTPVKAALSGVVAGVGNTDLVAGCYSYGKWIMIKHPDGLSTLYAHLSLPLVTTGQTVSTGDVIGYSGETGYATGPHLHFGVYATAGVVIKSYDSSLHCKGAVIPLADLSAYLNPLSYLPPLP